MDFGIAVPRATWQNDMIGSFVICCKILFRRKLSSLTSELDLFRSKLPKFYRIFINAFILGHVAKFVAYPLTI